VAGFVLRPSVDFLPTASGNLSRLRHRRSVRSPAQQERPLRMELQPLGLRQDSRPQQRPAVAATALRPRRRSWNKLTAFAGDSGSRGQSPAKHGHSTFWMRPNLVSGALPGDAFARRSRPGIHDGLPFRRLVGRRLNQPVGKDEKTRDDVHRTASTIFALLAWAVGRDHPDLLIGGNFSGRTKRPVGRSKTLDARDPIYIGGQASPRIGTCRQRGTMDSVASDTDPEAMAPGGGRRALPTPRGGNLPFQWRPRPASTIRLNAGGEIRLLVVVQSSSSPCRKEGKGRTIR